LAGFHFLTILPAFLEVTGTETTRKFAGLETLGSGIYYRSIDAGDFLKQKLMVHKKVVEDFTHHIKLEQSLSALSLVALMLGVF